MSKLNLFYVLAKPFTVENYQPINQNVTRDKSTVWVDRDTLDTTSTFMGEGGLDHAFVEATSSLDYVVFLFEEDKRIRRKYHRCVIPLHEYIFSLTGFNGVDVGVLNYLSILHRN